MIAPVTALLGLSCMGAVVGNPVFAGGDAPINVAEIRNPVVAENVVILDAAHQIDFQLSVVNFCDVIGSYVPDYLTWVRGSWIYHTAWHLSLIHISEPTRRTPI